MLVQANEGLYCLKGQLSRLATTFGLDRPSYDIDNERVV
jgi:hypothetical protein